jgi:hypothetical protein
MYRLHHSTALSRGQSNTRVEYPVGQKLAPDHVALEPAPLSNQHGPVIRRSRLRLHVELDIRGRVDGGRDLGGCHNV